MIEDPSLIASRIGLGGPLAARFETCNCSDPTHYRNGRRNPQSAKSAGCFQTSRSGCVASRLTKPLTQPFFKPAIRGDHSHQRARRPLVLLSGGASSRHSHSQAQSAGGGDYIASKAQLGNWVQCCRGLTWTVPARACDSCQLKSL